MDNLCVALLVWAIPECFHLQYKFLYYDEPCFLKAGTVHSVRKPGQGWECMDRKEEESVICSPPYHGEAMAKHIKASFRSPLWSVCSSVVFLLFLSTASRLCGQRGNIKYAEAKKQQYSPTLEDGKKEERLNGGKGGVGRGWGFWGFLSVTWKGICAGGHSALRIDCALGVFTGDVWIFD